MGTMSCSVVPNLPLNSCLSDRDTMLRVFSSSIFRWTFHQGVHMWQRKGGDDDMCKLRVLPRNPTGHLHMYFTWKLWVAELKLILWAVCSFTGQQATVYFSETKNTDKKMLHPALKYVKDSRSVCLGWLVWSVVCYNLLMAWTEEFRFDCTCS